MEPLQIHLLIRFDKESCEFIGTKYLGTFRMQEVRSNDKQVLLDWIALQCQFLKLIDSGRVYAPKTGKETA